MMISEPFTNFQHCQRKNILWPWIKYLTQTEVVKCHVVISIPTQKKVTWCSQGHSKRVTVCHMCPSQAYAWQSHATSCHHHYMTLLYKVQHACLRNKHICSKHSIIIFQDNPEISITMCKFSYKPEINWCCHTLLFPCTCPHEILFCIFRKISHIKDTGLNLLMPPTRLQQQHFVTWAQTIRVLHWVMWEKCDDLVIITESKDRTTMLWHIIPLHLLCLYHVLIT